MCCNALSAAGAMTAAGGGGEGGAHTTPKNTCVCRDGGAVQAGEIVESTCYFFIMAWDALENVWNAVLSCGAHRPRSMLRLTARARTLI